MLDLTAFVVKPSSMNKPNSVIFYGPPGGGKTWLAASAAEVKAFGKVLIIDTEGSTYGTLVGFDDANIDIFPISDIDTFDDLLDALVTGDHEYGTVVLDTIDVLQGMYIDKAMAEAQAKAGADKEPNTMGAWGKVRAWTVGVMDKLNRADFLSIVVAHQVEDKLESGRLMTRIALAGAAKEIVAGRADIVGYVTREIQDDETEVSTVQFGSSARAATKNRFALPVVMTAPSMSKIMAEITKKSTTTKEKK